MKDVEGETWIGSLLEEYKYFINLCGQVYWKNSLSESNLFIYLFIQFSDGCHKDWLKSQEMTYLGASPYYNTTATEQIQKSSTSFVSLEK